MELAKHTRHAERRLPLMAANAGRASRFSTFESPASKPAAIVARGKHCARFHPEKPAGLGMAVEDAKLSPIALSILPI
jgi:hypothetical protein